MAGACSLCNPNPRLGDVAQVGKPLGHRLVLARAPLAALQPLAARRAALLALHRMRAGAAAVAGAHAPGRIQLLRMVAIQTLSGPHS